MFFFYQMKWYYFQYIDEYTLIRWLYWTVGEENADESVEENQYKLFIYLSAHLSFTERLNRVYIHVKSSLLTGSNRLNK